FQRSQHVTSELIKRLGLEYELEGHQGCVNCLSWNENGRLLASGSDDVQVIIWDALRHKRLTSLRSGHRGNIFSVKFLPHTNDNVVISGAADCEIRVHDVTTKDPIHVISCHQNRVKRLVVTPDQSNVFWSAAEDGTVMQFDIRDPSSLKSEHPQCLLIDLKAQIGYYTEVKCLAINPAFSELLAVGANDPYVRMFDRRMLRCRSVTRDRSSSKNGDDDDEIPLGCVSYYVAGHLPEKEVEFRKRHRTLASTYVAFSPNGQELLVNLGGEQIYLFNIFEKRWKQKIDCLFKRNDKYSSEFQNDENGYLKGGWVFFNNMNNNNNLYSAICDRAFCSLQNKLLEDMKEMAKNSFNLKNYNKAVHIYNNAISQYPNISTLYCNRAMALSKRNWNGDSYAAMRDSCTAIRLDDQNLKAHFRLVKCLINLKWLDEASRCLLMTKMKFPNSQALLTLEKEIESAINNKKILDNTMYSRSSNLEKLSENEKICRSKAYDYEQRFCGHCNTTTDIKEANYFGSDGQYIVAGSDDGSFFIWDRKTTNIVRILRGDDSIVNCLEPHPTTCLLATSGIEPVVRLWSPMPADGYENKREIDDSDDAAQANQQRMNKDPIELMLLNMGYTLNAADLEGRGEAGGASGGSGSDSDAAMMCRTS
ncbi:hypothetical protein HELRODRAFT_65956, partial [Helobdella robusta]|uniref:Anaphase-promoting complex subunit 4 WD40 domain-containing protein n=1 Tax=Helobdella robusta TaxID=6412 RepID=T1FYF0_HELRO